MSQTSTQSRRDERPLLEVKNVSKRFINATALDDVSMAIPRQSIFGLLGPNGAGKSTLIRIINQITIPDEGAVYFDGERIRSHHISRIGYLPEERGLYKKMKVGEQLMYLGRLRGLGRKEVKQKLKFWFERFDIVAWWNKKVEDLSKGMAQKVQFISTVLNDPELLILDEPFSGFDPVNANLIRDEILRLREKGTTVIFSTHRMESVEDLCDDIVLINKAKKILDGPKFEVKQRFRSQTFTVRTQDAIAEQLTEAHFEVLGNDQDDFGLHRTQIRVAEDHSPNELLGWLTQRTQVYGLEEQIPSMNDIFIAMVEETGQDAQQILAEASA